jgi:two-component system chemotaxis response regulator CheB
MANRDIVAIGTSAGGVEALTSIAKALPENFPATLLVTIHLPLWPRSSLDQILTQIGPLKAHFALDGEPARKGNIYIAPPGYHLLLDGDKLTLGTGPRENSARPAIDPMMRSVAVCCGHRAVGVVLTGTLGDGASGLWALGQCNGITVVQDPHDAAFPDMPLNALNRVSPDSIVRLEDMPRVLESLVQQPASDPVKPPELVRYELEIARNGKPTMKAMDDHGKRSVLSCPDCGGVMWEVQDGDITRYRCHVGHAYTEEMMGLAVDENLTRALTSALRGFDERIALLEKMERDAQRRGHNQLAENWHDKAREYREEARIIRDALHRLDMVEAQGEAP